MSNIKDIIDFSDFSLNQDDSYKYMPNGASPYFLNVLKGEDGSYGELTNLKGNRKITYQLGDANTYFVLWSCYDSLTRNVYYYIFSQPFDTTGSGDYEYDNRILRFNEDTEVIDTIFYDTRNYFRFDPSLPIKDAFVLGDWLYVNPRHSEPKMFHIEMLYNYTNYDAYDATLTYTQGRRVTYFGGLFLANRDIAVGEDPVNYSDYWDREDDAYQDETDLAGNIYYDSEFRYAFNVLKHIPVYRPVCIYVTDEDHHANNVRGKLFRFAYRYKYFDNTYSRYGAYSDVTLPEYDEYYNGEVPNDIDEFNCIDVTIRLHSPALIKEVDIIFQETGGVWRRAKVVNRKDITLIDTYTYTHRFYNTDSAYEVIDDTYLHEPYDSVPKQANCQEIINKNILCFGGCTEGFDNLDKNDIDVNLTPEIEAISIDESRLQAGRYRDCLDSAYGDYQFGDIEQYWDDEFFRWVHLFHFDPWYATFGMAAGDIFIMTINGITVQYEIQLADVADIDTFGIAIITFLRNEFPELEEENAICYNPATDTISFIDVGSITKMVFYEPSGTTEVALTKKRGFKTGAWHPFCIFYYDSAMRRWDAQTSKDLPDGDVAWEINGTTVYVPMLSEYSPTPATTAYKWNIYWEVNHLPPSDAKWWRWGYAGNALCSEFVQYIIEGIGNEGNWTYMNIRPLQILKNCLGDEATWNEFPQSIIEPYSWQRGDRVRIITEYSVGTEMGVPVDGVYDFEILKIGDTDATEHYIYVQQFNHVGICVGEDSLIEIYRPQKTDTATVFHEFGELMPIIEDDNGTLVHGCGAIGEQNQDTVLGVPATGLFEAGDVYHILRTPSKPIDTIEGYFHESMWYSDFYESDDYDRGRIGVESNFGERYLNVVRYSDQYLQNTLINGMSTFHGGNYKELNDVYGDILRIIEIGDTLKVYQRKKPSSIFIGRTEYVDAEGDANIVETSTRILGSIRYSSTNYGTEFPESISRNNRYVYGFDIYNGVMWRDSANGIFPISGRYESTDGGGDYKMETYFKALAKSMLVSGLDGLSVLTVWDERHKNLYVIFKDMVTDANNAALMFHELSNKWICLTNMDQTPDEGWNEIVELDWWVLWGFEDGIGYYFDEDTRFAMFDFITTADNIVFAGLQTLALSLFSPTITASGTPEPDCLIMALSVPDPIAVATWVGADNNDLGIDYDDDSFAEAISTTVRGYRDSSDTGTVTLTLTGINDSEGSPITWLRVTNFVGNYYSVNDTLISDTPVGSPPQVSRALYFYSSPANDGGQRIGYVTIEDDYGNEETITVTQGASPLPVVVSMGVLYGDSWLSLSDTSYVALAGQTNVTLTFTPDHGAYSVAGTVYSIYWTAYLNRDDVYVDELVGTGVWSSIDDKIPNTETASWAATYPLLGGDTVVIWMTVNYVDSETMEPTYPLLALSLPAPTAVVSTVTVAGSPLTFLWDDHYDVTWADEQSFTVTKAPPTETCKIESKSSWLRLCNDAGVELYVGSSVDATGVGQTLHVVPDTNNTTGVAREGTIVFTNQTYGGSGTLTVYQNAAPATFEHDTIYISSSASSGLQFYTGSVQRVSGTDGTNEIRIAFYLDPTVGIHAGESSYTIFWRVYVNALTDAVATGSFDYQASAGVTLYSIPPNPIYLYTAPAVACNVTDADTIDVWISDFLFNTRS